MGAEVETLAQLKAFVEAGAGIALVPRAAAVHHGEPSPAVTAVRSLLRDLHAA